MIGVDACSRLVAFRSKRHSGKRSTPDDMLYETMIVTPLVAGFIFCLGNHCGASADLVFWYPDRIRTQHEETNWAKKT